MPLVDAAGTRRRGATQVDVLVSGGTELNGPIYDQLSAG